MKFLPSFLKKKKTSNTRRSHNFINPVRDWFIGLSIACMALIGGSVYIAYDFHEQFIETEEMVLLNETPLQYDEKKIHVWSEKFRMIEHTFENLRSDRVFVAPEEVTGIEDTDEETVPGIIEMQ